MSVAIITARSKSKSIKNKNMIRINGKNLVEYSIDAALKSKKIQYVFVDSDGDDILKLASKKKCFIIKRPNYLSGDKVSHSEVIRHSVKKVTKLLGVEPAIITVLLGNTVTNTSKLLDKSISILMKNKSYSSVMSVWEAGDDHPLRALKLKNGYLSSYFNLKSKISTNRQSYRKAYFYDQGPWTFRIENLKKKNGPGPWDWMGDKSFPIVRKWVTGRDIHGNLDIEISNLMLKKFKDI